MLILICMTQGITWRPVKYLDMWGRSWLCAEPYLPKGSADLLLEQILTMPKKAPINFSEACLLASKELGQRLRDGRVEYVNDFFDVWIEWVSGQGYHIELTGREFLIKSLQ